MRRHKLPRDALTKSNKSPSAAAQAAKAQVPNIRMEKQWKHRYIFLQDFWKAEKPH